MLDALQDSLLEKSERARFIKFVIENKIKINNVPKNKITEALWFEKFLPKRINRLYLLENKLEAVHDDAEMQANENAEERAALQALEKRIQDVRDREKFFNAVKKMPEGPVRGNCYQYLLDMPIYNLTKERYEALLQEAGVAEREYTSLLKKTVEFLWLDDLCRFELAYEILENQMKTNVINGQISVTDAKAKVRMDEV